MDLKERAAYIIGLADGLEPDYTTKEGKILKEMISLLSEVSDELTKAREDISQMFDELDAFDEDLQRLEREVFDDEDEDPFDGGLYEITCPECSEVVCVDEDMLDDDDISCPACGAKFEVDFDEDE